MDPAAAFAHLVDRGDGRSGRSAPVGLDRAAWCIAAAARGEAAFDPDAAVDALDQLATRCPASDFAALSTWLFVTEGFRGNRADYGDPRNSYLPDVLDRRLGIPITLTVVMMETGRRIGIDVVGIGMPGHFLAGDPTTPGRYCDPFHGGARLGVEDCARRYAEVFGSTEGFRPGLLHPVDDLRILDRMLANLQHHALRNSRRDLIWIARFRLRIPDRDPLDAEALVALLVEAGGFGAAREEYERLLGDAEARDDAAAVARIGRHRVAAQARSN